MATAMFRKLKPLRPTVIRVGDKVQTCHYYNELKHCIGPRCFWSQIGTCKFYNRAKKKNNFAAK